MIRMDNKDCRIRFTTYTIKDNIKRIFQIQLINDLVFQIKVAGINERWFMILESLLEILEEIIPIDE